MKVYIISILIFITNFTFSQVSTKELTDKYLGFNNSPREVKINNNLIYKFNEKGFLIEKLISNKTENFRIENIFNEDLLIKTKTYLNDKIYSIENYDYYSDFNISNYQNCFSNDTIKLKYYYINNKINKIIKNENGKEIITEYYYTKNKDSIVTSLNNQFLNSTEIIKTDTLIINKFYENNIDEPDQIIKTYINDKKLTMEEIYSFNSLIDKTYYIDIVDFDTKKINDVESVIILMDKRNNWIKKIKNNIVIEEREIKYDKFLNIKKIKELKHKEKNNFIYSIKYWKKRSN